jgi:hypothetical protein
MTITTWETTLDEQPLELKVSHDPVTREFVVWVDGFPTRRERLPELVWPQHRLSIPINGHQAEIVVTPGPHGLRCEALIDGQTVDREDPDVRIYQEAAGHDWWPARLQFDPSRYYELFPAWPRACAVACVLGAVLGVAAAWRAWSEGAFVQPAQALLLLGLTSTFTGVAWWWTDNRRLRDLMFGAELRPGVVVGLSPVRIAVPVDLAYNPEQTAPAVVVVEQPLDKLRPVVLGERVLMVLSYDHSQDGRLWHGLTLIAAECASTDEAAIRRLADALPESSWEEADRWNAAAGLPTTPGHWHVPTSSTRDVRTISDRTS